MKNATILTAHNFDNHYIILQVEYQLSSRPSTYRAADEYVIGPPAGRRVFSSLWGLPGSGTGPLHPEEDLKSP